MNDDKDWIGEPRSKWEPQIGPSDDVYSTLKKNGAEIISGEIGLDGEPLESPASYSDEEEIILLDSPVTCSDKEGAEISKKGSASLNRIMKATGILSSLLRELIAVGTTESWVSSERRPDQRFVDIEGEHLKEAVERLVPFDERKVAYEILHKEISVKRERDKIVGDILLSFAFPRCS